MKIDFVVARVVETKGFTGSRIGGKLNMEESDRQHRTDIYLMCREDGEVHMRSEELHLSYPGDPIHGRAALVRIESHLQVGRLQGIKLLHTHDGDIVTSKFFAFGL